MTAQQRNWDNANEVRQAFIDFFVKKQGHRFVKSSPVVPHNDPTLLFINAGMNQFKPVLLGRVDPNHPFYGMKRAANSQKCIRAGGKHNDLEDVGKDTYHHTFFEMLGNWSFGDYFKKEAISWAWELLTDVYKLDPSRLYVTYYGGDAREPNVPVDEEAKAEWLKYLPESRVLPFGMKENFWEMGDTGPCGPCSEIHYDRIGGRDAAHLVNQDDPDVLEIWNNVFMQFNREKDRTLTLLPAQSVDTGMGFERLASVLKGVRSNYDIDLFQHIFAAIKRECPEDTPAYGGKLHDEVDIAYRVVADHIRTLTIALSDGAVPSNQDRGYVLRRILRRAVRYGKEVLNAKAGFFGRLVDAVDETLGDVFPEIRKNKEDVRVILHEEEFQFGKTLDRGIREFRSRAEKSGSKILSGKDAFLLYTTFGFPLDLTQLMAREKGMTVDEAEFAYEMESFKNKSRDAGNFSMDNGLVLGAEQSHYLSEVRKIKPTNDALKYLWDPSTGTACGDVASVKIEAVWNGKTWLDSVDESSGLVGLVLDKTPFYAEAGGQIFDVGTINGESSFEFIVSEVRKFGSFILHIGQAIAGEAILGQGNLIPNVDLSRRALIAKNHTGTHILNYALREVLGDKVEQKGSLVDESKLRFDFSYGKPVELNELARIESIVNSIVSANFAVEAKEVKLADGQKINGLRVVPGETYPDPVRVVAVGSISIESMIAGQAEPAGSSHSSAEFCGGTHLFNTKDIHRMLILAEEGVQKGVRRIVAVTGPQATGEATLKAKAFIQEVEEASELKGELLAQTIASLRQRLGQDREIALTVKRQLLADVDTLKDELVKQEKELAKELLKTAVALGPCLFGSCENGGSKFEVFDVPELRGDAKALSACIDCIPEKEIGVLLISRGSSNVSIVASVPKNLSERVSAKSWVDAALLVINGKGGGSPLRAQGQSSQVNGIDLAVEAAKAFPLSL